MGQTLSNNIDVHENKELLEAIKEYKPTVIEHIVPEEMNEVVGMYVESRKTEAD